MGEVVWPDSTLTYLANGEQCASRGLSKFIVPVSRTVQPGKNLRLFGFGVSCVCTNIVLPKITSNCDECDVIQYQKFHLRKKVAHIIQTRDNERRVLWASVGSSCVMWSPEQPSSQISTARKCTKQMSDS